MNGVQKIIREASISDEIKLYPLTLET